MVVNVNESGRDDHSTRINHPFTSARREPPDLFDLIAAQADICAPPASARAINERPTRNHDGCWFLMLLPNRLSGDPAYYHHQQ
jgi:hypothetical protein